MRAKPIVFDWGTDSTDKMRHNIKTRDRFQKYCKRRKHGLRWWVGGRGGNGYGAFRYGGRSYNAQRIAYALFIGPVGAGLHVLHKNDEPLCVDPSVLFLGTQADNNKDRDSKGRGVPPPHVPGEKCGKAKLTKKQVLDIRYRFEHDKYSTLKNLAAKHAVSDVTIGDVISRRTWKHI